MEMLNDLGFSWSIYVVGFWWIFLCVVNMYLYVATKDARFDYSEFIFKFLMFPLPFVILDFLF
jgi:hypothetical protein